MPHPPPPALWQMGPELWGLLQAAALPGARSVCTWGCEPSGPGVMAHRGTQGVGGSTACLCGISSTLLGPPHVYERPEGDYHLSVGGSWVSRGTGLQSSTGLPVPTLQAWGDPGRECCWGNFLMGHRRWRTDGQRPAEALAHCVSTHSWEMGELQTPGPATTGPFTGR